MRAKILVIKLRSLGDTVLMTAPLKELSTAYPQAQLHVLINPDWAALFEYNPSIQKIWTYKACKSRQTKIQFKSLSRPFRRASGLVQLAYRLRQEKYDWVINLHASPSSSLLALATGAKTRSIHFHGHRDTNRFSTAVIPGKGVLKPIIERDMDALRALGLHVPAGKNPVIQLHPSEIREAQNWLNLRHLSDPILALSLGASRPTKCWPMDRFAALAIEWVKKKQGSVLAFAGPNEEPLIHHFLSAIDDLLSSVPSAESRILTRAKILTTYQLNLRALAGVLSQVSVSIGNDSGNKHLAISVGTPTITLFGPEDPYEWHPYSPDQHPYFFIESLPCRREGDPGMPPWCGLSECIEEEHRCMRLIGVEPVLKAAQKMARTHLNQKNLNLSGTKTVLGTKSP